MTTPCSSPLAVVLLAFDGMEALDFAGPFEVFTTASRMAQRLQMPAPFVVHSVSVAGLPVTARAGLRVLPDASLANGPAADLVLVPGGVMDHPLTCPATLEWIAQASAGARLTASVCTGVFALAKAGVVHSGPVTTHWEDSEDLRRQWPSLEVVSGVRWVDQGHVVTSAGISAGIDMCLHLVARLSSPALAERTARQMDYPWDGAP